ncbi:MAG: hypothetical protein U5K37_06350 [Natrialbaceae archaeon]|nr:hypothetical protein [Natrialbaceae archaeon]
MTELSEEPFRTSLKDIRGLKDEVEKLQQTFLFGLTQSDAFHRLPALTLYGPKGVGKRRLGRAIVSELVSQDFKYLHITADKIPARRAQRAARTDPELQYLVEKLTSHEPAVLLLEDLQDVYLEDNSDFNESIRELRRNNCQVGVICIFDQDHDDRGMQARDEFDKLADINLYIPDPGQQRRSFLLHANLTQLVRGTSITLAFDEADQLPAVDGQLPGEAFEHIARRAVVLAQSETEDAPEVTPDHIQRAIEHVSDERREPNFQDRYESSVDAFCDPEIPAVSFTDIGGLYSCTHPARRGCNLLDGIRGLSEFSTIDGKWSAAPRASRHWKNACSQGSRECNSMRHSLLSRGQKSKPSGMENPKNVSERSSAKQENKPRVSSSSMNWMRLLGIDLQHSQLSIVVS